MPLNLSVRHSARAVALAAGLLAVPAGLPAQGVPCPPAAGEAVAAGWGLYRAGEVARARERFRAADRLCAGNLDAKVGLGYVALRQGRAGDADSLFRIVVGRSPSNADAWEGLAHAAWRLGDRKKALHAARRAVALQPDNPSVRALLDRLDPDWNRPPGGARARPGTLQLPARVRGERFEVPAADGWSAFYVKGVNLGVALPGRFPAEFPQDSARYAGWLDTIAGMNANAVRLYTILPPTFYRALRGWNLAHPDRALRLIQGVWTELPPGDDFEHPKWKADFRAEMRRAVDVVNGAVTIPARPGHASGRYDADVSTWTLAYIVGREWEPYAVKAFDASRPKPVSYRGRFLRTAGPVPAMDAWLAEQCDYLLGYEADRHNTLRPIAYTNWPTLDPLAHPTEATTEEERAWRERRGQRIDGMQLEYENDAIGLDASLVQATEANPAGWFASYHAYPYYPDFMLHDPEYNRARSSEGPSNYFGYLLALRRHHAGLPLLVAEYGVPSSRGIAHLQPQGWHHGGHDERAMAEIDARLTREIRESGAAGGVIFAWMDEWFKRNWVVIDLEIPGERTRLWHNVMDAEQNYGILGMYAGDSATRPAPGGDPARWLALPALQRGDGSPGAPTLRVGSDASYVYLAVELAGFRGRRFPWDSLGVQLALDTYRTDLGQRLLPGSGIRSEIGFEFLVDLRGPGDAELRVVPEYDPYGDPGDLAAGEDLGRFYNRPATITRREDGRFDSLLVVTNRSRFGRDGTLYPALGYNRGRLRFGTLQETTLADWWYDAGAGLLELRLPWNLLNVTDPSSATLLFETRAGPSFGTATSDGFRMGVLTYRKGMPAGGEAPTTARSAPALVGGRWVARDFQGWRWPTWEEPTYHQRLKPVYGTLRQAWGAMR